MLSAARNLGLGHLGSKQLFSCFEKFHSQLNDSCLQGLSKAGFFQAVTSIMVPPNSSHFSSSFVTSQKNSAAGSIID